MPTAASTRPTPRSRATRDATSGRASKVSRPPALAITDDTDRLEIALGDRRLTLTNPGKVFWPELGLTKGDLLRYYAAVSPVLVPHLRDRAMVMKRYPNGIAGEFFFQKRTPAQRPDWLRTCSIEHRSKSVIDFPVIDDPAALLWLVNLGCIDMNPWYARCDDVQRPDYLHFDLDPTPGATFAQVREAALAIRDDLAARGLPCYPKTTGSRGIHVYVPIARGPLQKQVWTFAKAFARSLEKSRRDLVTSEYRVAARPRCRVLVDYNQNAWGRTLASVYSVRPTPRATVSVPVTWEEVASGIEVDDFHLRNVPSRVNRVGDLFAPLLAARGRPSLEPHLP